MRGKILKYIIPVLVIVLFTVGFFCIKERMTSIDVSVDEIEFIEVEASEQAAFYTETSKQQVSDYLNGLDDLEIYHKGDPILGTPTYWITVHLSDGGTIQLQEGGIIIIEDGEKERWLQSEQCFAELLDMLLGTNLSDDGEPSTETTIVSEIRLDEE